MNLQVFDSVEMKFVNKTWADVCVGDVITVHKVSSQSQAPLLRLCMAPNGPQAVGWGLRLRRP